MPAKTVGFIGLGMMGTPMVACLTKRGFDVAVFDVNEARVETVCKTYGTRRLSHDLGRSLDVLITMLPNSTAVEDVLLRDGWAACLAQGTIVIDMSSSEPVRSRRLGKDLADSGLSYLDAPVSGGVRRASCGELSILVGGSVDRLAASQSVLEAMGTSILHIGDTGSGHAAKALNNFVSAAGLTATVEALHVAQRFGIDPAVMTDVLNSSTGRTNTSENKVRQFMLNESFASGFSLRLMAKDLQIAASLADSVGYQLRLGQHCIGIWHEIAAISEPSADHTELYRYLGERG